MNFPTLEARDMVPDLFAETLKRNMRMIDAHDRAIGGSAD